MPQYLLLLRADPAAFAHMSPEEMQQTIQKYNAWRQSLERDGAHLASNKLHDGQGRVMRKAGGGVRVTDGPYSESKEVLGGYFLIDAADEEAATERARACPHLEFGSIEIRAIEQM